MCADIKLQGERWQHAAIMVMTKQCEDVCFLYYSFRQKECADHAVSGLCCSVVLHFQSSKLCLMLNTHLISHEITFWIIHPYYLREEILNEDIIFWNLITVFANTSTWIWMITTFVIMLFYFILSFMEFHFLSYPIPPYPQSLKKKSDLAL